MEKLRQNCDEHAQNDFLVKFKDGDNDSFKDFYLMYKPMIIKIISSKCKHQDRDDVIQEILIKIYKNRESYDPSKSKMSTWVCNISKNLVIDIYRKENNKKRKDKNSDVSTETIIDNKDKIDVSTKFMDHLSSKEIDLLMMKYVKNMTSESIAVHLGSTKSSVVANIHSIKEKVKSIYGKNSKNNFIL